MHQPQISIVPSREGPTSSLSIQPPPTPTPQPKASSWSVQGPKHKPQSSASTALHTYPSQIHPPHNQTTRLPVALLQEGFLITHAHFLQLCGQRLMSYHCVQVRISGGMSRRKPQVTKSGVCKADSGPCSLQVDLTWPAQGFLFFPQISHQHGDSRSCDIKARVSCFSKCHKSGCWGPHSNNRRKRRAAAGTDAEQSSQVTARAACPRVLTYRSCLALDASAIEPVHTPHPSSCKGKTEAQASSLSKVAWLVSGRARVETQGPASHGDIPA